MSSICAWLRFAEPVNEGPLVSAVVCWAHAKEAVVKIRKRVERVNAGQVLTIRIICGSFRLNERIRRISEIISAELRQQLIQMREISELLPLFFWTMVARI